MRSLGKYQLIEQIGVGGFGEVFKGFDPYIKRHVAVKTCSSDSEEMRTRFFHEAEIAGNLHHKNITTVYDFGLQDGLPYLIQEYLTGEDLDRKVKRRDFLPYPEKLFYLLQIARGLAYAHSKGVIHRDIKPANIRILEDGTTKIMDFGIAKLAQQETGLTQTGMTLGTAAYLAPEQIRGEPVNPQTDIFSFGVLAYELLTYHRPFPGDQISAVLYSLLNTEPQPIEEHWPAAPQDIVDLIGRCLSKQADRRFADGGELQRGLETIQKQGAMERSGAIDAEPGPGTGTGTTQNPTTAAPTPTPRSLDEMEITLMGSAAVPEPPSSAVDSASLSASEPTPSGGVEAGSASSAHDVTARYATRSPKSGAGKTPWIVVAVLAAIAAVGGWWLGSRGNGTEDEPTEETSTVETIETVDVGEDDGSTAVSRADSDDSGDPGGDGEPVPRTVRSRLVLQAPDWTDEMTAQVDSGPVRGLSSHQTVTVDAGRHVVVFALDEDGYSTQSRQVVELSEGERLTLRPDIEPPALLSVRPLPLTPQGIVRIDGGGERSTPLANLRLAPGSHRIEIQSRTPGEDGTRAVLSRDLDLASGQRAAVTFDLESGRINVTGD